MPQALQVLFVDDEPQVLESLQDTLRPRRREWDMAFTPSARAALTLLGKRRFDVVVSDVRMPEMDGVTFFEEVRHQWPESIRIALTGHVDAQASRRLARVAHQYLSKPTSTEALQETLERAARVRHLIADPRVRGIVGRIEHLPPRPRVFGQLVTALEAPNSSAGDIARIVESDPALAAKLLQIVNSSFFRLARSISRIEDAVVHLGLEQIRCLALSAEIFQGGAALSAAAGLSLDRLQQHALLVGRVSSRIASAVIGNERADRPGPFGPTRSVGNGKADRPGPSAPTRSVPAGEELLAGIVHEIGLLVLGLEMPQRLARAFAKGREAQIPFPEALRTSIGATSGDVGGYLLGLWGLPEPLLEAVVHHHAPAASGARFGLAGVLHVADALASRYLPPVDGFPTEALDEAYLAAAGVSDRLAAFSSIAAEEAAAVGVSV